MKIDCEPIQSGKNEIRLRSEMFPQNAKRTACDIALIRIEWVSEWVCGSPAISLYQIAIGFDINGAGTQIMPNTKYMRRAVNKNTQ